MGMTVVMSEVSFTMSRRPEWRLRQEETWTIIDILARYLLRRQNVATSSLSHDNEIVNHLRMMTPDEFRNALETLGWTQARAARYLGLTLRTISRYVMGKSPIRRPVEIAIDEALTHAGKPRPRSRQEAS
jgi:transcriptional regulator with GAF, ATPase, and Fis domain